MPLNPVLKNKKFCSHECCDNGICEAIIDISQYRVTCPAAPLQIDGNVSGVPFYFRARHHKWRLEAYGEIIGSGDTDDFTYGQAVDLIYHLMEKWIWDAT